MIIACKTTSLHFNVTIIYLLYNFYQLSVVKSVHIKIFHTHSYYLIRYSVVLINRTLCSVRAIINIYKNFLSKMLAYKCVHYCSTQTMSHWFRFKSLFVFFIQDGILQQPNLQNLNRRASISVTSQGTAVAVPMANGNIMMIPVTEDGNDSNVETGINITEQINSSGV